MNFGHLKISLSTKNETHGPHGTVRIGQELEASRISEVDSVFYKVQRSVANIGLEPSQLLFRGSCHGAARRKPHVTGPQLIIGYVPNRTQRTILVIMDITIALIQLVGIAEYAYRKIIPELVQTFS